MFFNIWSAACILSVLAFSTEISSTSHAQLGFRVSMPKFLRKAWASKEVSKVSANDSINGDAFCSRQLISSFCVLIQGMCTSCRRTVENSVASMSKTKNAPKNIGEIIFLMKRVAPGALTLFDVLKWKRVRHNLLSTALGLLVALALIPALFYLYTEGFKIEDNVGADIFIFFLSVFCGVCYKVLFLEIEIDRRFDITSGTIALVGTFIWFTTCSYTECANIYKDPLQQNATGH